MTRLVLFHHVQGLTDGLREFAERLRAGRHQVDTPDLFEGHRFDTIDQGLTYANSVGDAALTQRAELAVAELPADVVFGGFSFGAASAQRFAQTRAGALGALLYEACIPITGDWAFGPWPDRVPVQIHGMDQDPFFALEGDLDAARELVQAVGPELAELFVYPGDRHLFCDSSLPSYDAAATSMVVERSVAFLDRLDRQG